MTSSSRRPTRSTTESAAALLERGRDAYRRHAWRDALDALSKADEIEPLDDDDLERLAWSGALAGRNDVQCAALERLHDLRLGAGDPLGAGRAAFWLGFRLLFVGEPARGGAWLGRAQKLIEQHADDCVERGFLLLPEAYGLLSRKGDAEAALATARRAGEIAERFDEADLASMARMLEGQAHVALGRHDEGLAVLDQAMLPATTDRLTPVVTGIVYCAVIGCCQRVYALSRAREWTTALAAWCDAQPQLEAFTGHCRVHRSEIMQLQGAWPEAIEEARVAARSSASHPALDAEAAACYQQGEILRLRGEFAPAEDAYRKASELGREPQPGLALLRLAQGRGEAAAAAIRQATGAKPEPLARTRYLPAAVEILIAVGDLDGAAEAARDLERIAAATTGNPILNAMAAHAGGAVRLARGEARDAIDPLRRAFAAWQQVGAPYLAARIRVLIANALAAVGDEDGAALERGAARVVFRDLGAIPDLDRLDPPPAARRSDVPCGLTSRELEVLRLLASGRTNKAISHDLFLSEKTVDRHVSNIFSKIDVHTRAAATAFAYRHQLV